MKLTKEWLQSLVLKEINGKPVFVDKYTGRKYGLELVSVLDFTMTFDEFDEIARKSGYVKFGKAHDVDKFYKESE